MLVSGCFKKAHVLRYCAIRTSGAGRIFAALCAVYGTGFAVVRGVAHVFPARRQMERSVSIDERRQKSGEGLIGVICHNFVTLRR